MDILGMLNRQILDRGCIVWLTKDGNDMSANGSNEFPQIDARGLPTPVCPVCGEEWLVIPVKFFHESYTIAIWGTDGYCYSCKSKVTACTPLDLPNGWERPGDDDE
jgi:hypothetical protein